MPKYDDDVRNARKTAERFERAHSRRAAKAAACDDGKLRGDLLFGNWMITRRIAAYHRFADCQDRGIHEVAQVLNGNEVCTCGLIAEGALEGTEGHIL